MMLDEETRARESGGTSADAIYAMAHNTIRRRHATRAGRLLDIGCGTGAFRRVIADMVAEYVGVDIARYEGFPSDATFIRADLGRPSWPIEDEFADITVSLETIEHVENPRSFIREIFRVTKPGGLIVVSTPNQLTWLSLLTLVVKNQFNAFQERTGQYPSHLTALLEIDLLRTAREVGLSQIDIIYSGEGRVPGISRHWPRWLSRGRRRFSDNLALVGRRPANGQSGIDREL